MTDFEIPYEKDRHGHYRFFEALPALLTWSMLALPFVLSAINVTAAAVFVLAYLLIYFTRSIGVDVRALQGYRILRQHEKLDWPAMLEEIEAGEVKDASVHRPKWHYNNLLRLGVQAPVVKPSDLLHVVMIAVYKESREVVEPTIHAVMNSAYDMKKVMLVIAYEERGGPEVERRINDLIAEYGKHFYYAVAYKHPKDIPGELVGKGGNITFAAHGVQRILEERNIDPIRVVVTTLDADNRPHKYYLTALSYTYSVCQDPLHTSFQPISMYTNNIWDAPAPMRVIATGNTFYNIVLAQRQHMLRNFSAHSQSMAALIKTNFWSVRTIVEDGHQFWRTYFRFDGNHTVFPIYIPIYQDAVLNDSYVSTLKAQFIQLRRWTYGASDIAYVIEQGYFKKNNVPRRDLLIKLLRLIESHVTWATGPLLCLFIGFIPALFHPLSYTANELPLIVSRIQQFALAGLLASLFVCLKTLPPKPPRYTRRRNLWMLIQWVYLPVTTIIYNSFAALYSQTRLMLGRYYEKFDVTEKAVVSTAESGASVTRK